MAASYTPIEYGEWLPDHPEFGLEGVTEINNVIPSISGYRPLNSLTQYTSGTITDKPLGAAAFTYNDTNFIFCGDTSTLYKLDASTLTWTDVSKSGGYTTDLNGAWRSTVYGTHFIFTNFNNNPQYYNMATGSAFADLTTSVKGRHIATVNNFVVMGNTWDAADGEVPNRIRWSALDNPTDWTPSPTTQSDWQDLPSGGDVFGIVGGEWGTILTQRSIYRMTYIGSPYIWQFDEVEEGRGALVSESITNVGPLVFFLDEDGFYITNGGGPAQNIGNEKINRWFLNDVDENYWDKMSATVDPYNQLVFWSYAGAGNTDGNPNRVLIYNYALGKWSKGDAAIELLVRLVTLGTSLEGLDSVSASIDDLLVSLDSRVWKGGKTLFAALNSTGQVYQFDGTPLDATIETGQFQFDAPKRSFVSGATPLADGGTSTVQIAGIANQNDTPSFGSAASQDADGLCHFRSDGRYHKFRENITGTWSNTQGLIVQHNRAGLR